MPRKYFAEFKGKAVRQIHEMVRLESYSRQRAYEEVGELLVCTTTRCAPGTATAS